MISDRARESFAQSILASLVWQIPISELRRVIEGAPRIALRIAEQMEKRFRRVESRVEGLALRELREARRIATRQRRFTLLDPVGLRLDAGREKPQSG